MLSSKLTLKSLDGIEFDLHIPSGRQIDAAPFFLSVHKAGSTLQFGIVEAICKKFNIAFLNMPAQLFEYGFRPENCGIDVLGILEQNYVCTGFREVCSLHCLRRYWSAPKRLLLRDPRDIVVSLYCSVQNHSVPVQDGPVKQDILGARDAAVRMDISEFVLAGIADDILMNMRTFLRQAEEIPYFKVTKYEDVIFEKRQWIGEIAEELKVRLSPGFVEELLEQFDVFPATENPTAFIRKVVPGDYVHRLNPQALAYLETRFRDVFARLEYPLCST